MLEIKIKRSDVGSRTYRITFDRLNTSDTKQLEALEVLLGRGEEKGEIEKYKEEFLEILNKTQELI